jgi:hypothetical protein
MWRLPLAPARAFASSATPAPSRRQQQQLLQQQLQRASTAAAKKLIAARQEQPRDAAQLRATVADLCDARNWHWLQRLVGALSTEDHAAAGAATWRSALWCAAHSNGASSPRHGGAWPQQHHHHNDDASSAAAASSAACFLGAWRAATAIEGGNAVAPAAGAGGAAERQGGRQELLLVHELALAACAGAGKVDLALATLAALEKGSSSAGAGVAEGSSSAGGAAAAEGHTPHTPPPWPPLRAYAPALAACARGAAPQQLLELLMRVRARGHDPGDAATFDLALEAHARAGDATEAMRWLDSRPSSAQNPTGLAQYNWVLRARAAGGPAGGSGSEGRGRGKGKGKGKGEGKGEPLNRHASLAAAALSESVVSLMGRMGVEGVEPDGASFAFAAAALARARDVEGAAGMVEMALSLAEAGALPRHGGGGRARVGVGVAA